MSKLSVFFAHAMDARSREDIVLDDEKYTKLLSTIGGVITNPYRQKSQNLIQHGLSIAQRNLMLLRTSDIVLADLSVPNYQYIGCIFEIVHASINDVPVVLVVGDNDFSDRLLFQAYCDFIARNADEAIEYIRRAYTQEGVERQMIEMQTYYNEIAHKYMDKSVRTHKQSQESIEFKKKERAELRTIIRKYVKGKVCQIGIGTGDWTKTIGETSDRVVGVEQSQEMLVQARLNLASYGNITFMHCDALKEDISGGPFDCVVIFFLLSLLPRSMQDRLLNRVQKILKPGGLLVIADTKKLGDLPAMGLGRRQLQQRKSDNKVFILYKEHFVGDSLVGLLEKKGYEVIDASRKSVWFPWAISRVLG